MGRQTGMPRIARQYTHVPGALAHVIVRFVDGRFVLDDHARSHYLGLLAQALRSSDWRLISYALMSSHVHLGCLIGETELRSWALPVHIRFAQWINRRVAEDNPKSLGHVIADRPTTKVMCPSRARFLMAYHHRNPIEAGVATDPAESTWTSHRAYLGLAPCEGGLDLELGLELAGFEPSREGRRQLHEFVSRAALRIADLDTTEAVVPVRPKARVPLTPTDVVRVVARVLDVPMRELVRGSRAVPVVMARRVALMVWIERGFAARDITAVLGISPSGASRLLGRRHDTVEVRAGVDRVAAILDEEHAREERDASDSCPVPICAKVN